MSHTCRGEALGRWLCGSKKYRIFSSFPSDPKAQSDPTERRVRRRPNRALQHRPPPRRATPCFAKRHVFNAAGHATRVTTRRPAPRKYDFDAVRPEVQPNHCVGAWPDEALSHHVRA